MDSNNSDNSKSRNLIIGIGNDFRGDDGVGIVIASKLREHNIPGYEIIEYGGEGTGLVALWKGADKVIVIDATFSRAEPGKIYRFEIGKDVLPTNLFAGYSTHAIGLAEAIELSKTLDCLPRTLIIYGIEGKSYESGQGLTNEIAKSAELVISKILEEI
jgi:hydrogenase maturation protease